jgi:hypothetical protein
MFKHGQNNVKIASSISMNEIFTVEQYVRPCKSDDNPIHPIFRYTGKKEGLRNLSALPYKQ